MERDDRMDVVGHDDIFVDRSVGEMLRDTNKKFFSNLSKAVQLLHSSENALALMGADGNKIAIGCCIVIFRNPIAFAFRMTHDTTSGE